MAKNKKKKNENHPGIDSNYVPTVLPCGKEVNQNWKPGDLVECCMTVCSQKSPSEIDRCYRQHQKKKKLEDLDRFGEDLPDTSGKYRLFYH